MRISCAGAKTSLDTPERIEGPGSIMAFQGGFPQSLDSDIPLHTLVWVVRLGSQIANLLHEPGERGFSGLVFRKSARLRS